MPVKSRVLLGCTALLGTCFVSNAFADTVNGTAGADMLVGAAGASTVSSGGGNDAAFGDQPAGDAKIAAIQLVSKTASGTLSNGANGSPQYSPDGTRIVFCSDASNLVPNDTNNARDVFVKDLVTGAVQRVSTTASGAQVTLANAANGCNRPSFSPDGTKVIFSSEGALVAGDKNADNDVYIKTLSTGAIQRVSTNGSGVEGSSDSLDPVFSPDGRFVAFRSYSNNLVAGDTNGTADVFVKNLATGAVTRLSTTAGGGQADNISYAPSFSPDGGRLVFASLATNLVGGDTNGSIDIFVKTISSGAITRVSTNASGNQASGHSEAPSFSSDGKWVVFQSAANDLVGGDSGNTDIFAKNLVTGQVLWVSTTQAGVGGNGDSKNPTFSPDGTHVLFISSASNLANEQNSVRDAFVKNIKTGAIQIASIGLSGAWTKGSTDDAAFGPDGSEVTFRSAATFVPGDTNGQGDVFRVVLSAGPAGADKVNGGSGNDTVAGAAGNDVVLGGPGLDHLFGGTGADTLVGGAGPDLLNGGPGADKFRYDRVSDSSRTAPDTIYGFSSTQGDKVVLTGIDAIAGTAANDAFTYIGAKAFSGKKGQLRYAAGVLQGDVNGDKKADLVIRVKGLTASQIVR